MNNISIDTVRKFLIKDYKSRQDLADFYKCDITTINRFIIKHNLKTDICIYCGKLFHSSKSTIRHCSLQCRILDKTIWQNGCLIYIGKHTVGIGHKRIGINGKNILVHRAVYKIVYGEIPKNKFVCHKCDNPSCINPKHLFIGVQKDNMKDCKKKKRIKNNPHKMHNREFLTQLDIQNIRNEYIKNDPEHSLKALGQKYSVHFTTISRIINFSDFWRKG